MEESAEERRERQRKYWDKLWEVRYGMQSRYEKLIVYLSVGAISVLIAFIEYKFSEDGLLGKRSLLLAFVLLVAALVFALSGIAFSIHSHDKVLKDVSVGRNPNLKNCWNQASYYSFVLSPILLVAGIIAVLFFICSNVGV